MNPRDEGEMLLWMLLIHTHAVELVNPVADSSPPLTFVHGATQRGAATAIAELWPDQEDKERTSHRYWYHEYAVKYEGKTIVPPDKAGSIEALRKILEADPRIKAVTLDIEAL